MKLRFFSALEAKWNGLFRGNFLRVTCFAGLILLVLIGGTVGLVYFLGSGRGGKGGEADKSFYPLLREYDRAAAPDGGNRPDIEHLDRELDKLEKKAGGLESWLSVLKRRRHLARLDPRYIPAWRQSALRARQVYPYSEPLAALAAAALIQGSAITGETERELRACLPLFTDSRFAPLALSLHALLGDMKDPETAAELLPPALTAGEGVFSVSAREILTGDLAIVKLLKGDAAGAGAEIQSLLAAYAAGSSPSGGFLRFAAEYCYDFGDMSRAAELFSRLPGEEALFRQADALWLAGYPDSARAIWSMLDAPRALYNLAFTSENPAEAAVLLERLVNLPGGGTAASGDPSRLFGLIRYSRFLDASRATAILEASRKAGGLAETGTFGQALIELEILRRGVEQWGPGRTAAETWLLLGRYPEEERLYRWGAWFFDFQRQYGETAMLLTTAARRRLSGQWVSLHEALQLVRAGDMESAESLLASVSAGAFGWTASANLGRIFEARHSPARALEYYEIASAAAPDRETASRIQLRVARCLKTLDRVNECRQALEYALDLNPDNLSARLELDRLGLP